VTLSRYHLALLALVVVIGGGVGIAWYYVENVYKEREKETDLIKQGRAEELVGKPPPKQPGPPPLERSTSRQHYVLTVHEGHLSPPTPGMSVCIRGNGEFMRLPALPDERGPVVTGILDRARVDEILRKVAESVESPGGEHYVQIMLLPKTTPQGRNLTRAQTKEILELTGREMNRSAVPEGVFLKLAPAEGGDAVAWPFERQKPATFEGDGKILIPESDRARFRDGLLLLLDKKAKFSIKDKVWRVVQIDLILGS
jgi:hypothetical protein